MNTDEEKKESLWPEKKRSRLFYNIFYTIVLASSILLITAVIVPQLLNVPRCTPESWESRAKATLGSYYETQLAYQESLKTCNFASWEELTRTNYLAEGYTQGNMIENYSLLEYVWNDVEGTLGPRANTFTLVAFPRTTDRPGYLSTFVIREDGILRSYKKPKEGIRYWGEDGDFGARTWKEVKMKKKH
jgi:hypothetical protein